MENSEKALKIIIRNNDGTSSDITMYSVDGKLPTTIEIGGIMKKNEVTVSETEITDDGSSTLTDNPKDDLESQTAEKKIDWLRIYTTIQQILTALCSLVTSIIMIMTLVKFFSTSHIAGAWPTNPKLYPTYILLIVSLMSLSIDLLHLGARYCGSASARKADLMASKLRHTIMVIQAIASATGAGIFKGTRDAGSGQDLFGWTCSGAADQFAAVNSSDLICQSNLNSSIIALLQTSLHVLGIIITIVSMLMPKEPDATDLRSSKDDPQSSPKPKLGSPKPSPQPDTKNHDKPDDSKKPADDKSQDSDTKQDEPEPDANAITRIVSQSQALYTRLQTGDQADFGNYDGSEQTGYADVDVNPRQTNYDDFDMRGYR